MDGCRRVDGEVTQLRSHDGHEWLNVRADQGVLLVHGIAGDGHAMSLLTKYGQYVLVAYNPIRGVPEGYENWARVFEMSAK